MPDHYEVVEVVVSLFSVTAQSRRRAQKTIERLSEQYSLSVEELTALQSAECAYALDSLLRFGFLTADGRRKGLTARVKLPVIEEQSLRLNSERASPIYERMRERDIDQFSRATLTLLSSALLGNGEMLLRCALSGEALAPLPVQLH